MSGLENLAQTEISLIDAVLIGVAIGVTALAIGYGPDIMRGAIRGAARGFRRVGEKYREARHAYKEATDWYDNQIRNRKI